MVKKQTKPTENEILLGLDPGIANFGWAIYYTDDGFNESGVIKTKKTAPDHHRMLEAVEGVDSILRKYEIDYVYIEQMMIHDTMPAIIKGYGARMCVLVHLTGNGVLFQEFNPTTTKKTLLGKGVADKGAMEKAVRCWFNLPERRMAEHEIDSYAQIAMGILENKIACPSYDKIRTYIKRR